MLMEVLLFIGFILVVVAIAFAAISRRPARTNSAKAEEEYEPKYVYTRKQFIMSRAENDFYGALQQAVGTNYVILPQVHLGTFLDHRIKGQKWAAALSVIQRKSVDFLICNREYYNPLVAIELDDVSHDALDRQKRDKVVEAICARADMPLVRIRWRANYDTNALLTQLAPYLK